MHEVIRLLQSINYRLGRIQALLETDGDEAALQALTDQLNEKAASLEEAVQSQPPPA